MTQTPKVEKQEWTLGGVVAGDLKVVNAEYCSALETALKAARELISDSSTEINEPYLYDRYWDALAKVDVK